MNAVVQLVEALRYKPVGRGLIPDGVTGIFIDLILPAALWPWVDLASTEMSSRDVSVSWG
jgi:hypothetical protein